MKIKLLVATVFLTSISTAEACTEVFLHRDNVSMVGRTMDFPINMGSNIVGYNKGNHQVSSFLNKEFPNAKVAEWDVKYPFLGREIFNTGLVLDGSNNQGLSAAYLYLPGTTFKKYDPNDINATLNFYDLVTYVLATSKDVNEALDNISKYQVSGGAIIVTNDIAVNNIPIHLSLKDKSGNSAVIESIDGKLNIYKGQKAGNVLTNYPDLPQQFDNLSNYNSLLNYNKEDQKNKFENIPGFETMIASSSLRNNIVSMVGIPGDYSPPSRFVRATYLESNIPVMQYSNDYKYMVNHILNSVTVPYSNLPNSTATQWKTIKNLNNNEIEYNNILYLYKGKLIIAGDTVAKYNIDQIFSTEIKNINGYQHLSSQIINPEKYKYYSMSELSSNI